MKNESKNVLLKIVFILLAIAALIFIIVIINNLKYNKIESSSGKNNHNTGGYTIDEELGTYYINNSGDFKINGQQVYVLEQAQKIYGDIPIGTQISYLIDKMGEPIVKKEYILMTCYTFDLGNNNLLKVSSKNETGEIVEKLILINSMMDQNVQLSTEIKTDIDNLSERVDKITEKMNFEDVVSILGNKYIEIEETDKGLHTYVWLDIYENRVEISFDRDNKVYELGHVMAEW